MKPLNCAVIGMGTIFWGHLNAYLENPKTNLLAVCDQNEEWLHYIQKKYGIERAYTDYHALLDDPDIDLVSICLPNKFHCPVTVEALRKGKHVLCEKPMALNAAEGRAMRAAELESGKKLMISQNQRFEQGVQVMKIMARRGEYGDIYYARIGWRRELGGMPSPNSQREDGSFYNRNWFNEYEQGGGVLRDLGAHVIDLTLDILGFPKLEGTYCSLYRKFEPDVPETESEKYKYTSEDLATALMKFEGGVAVQLEVSFGSLIPEGEILTDLYGTKMGTRRFPEMQRVVKDKGDGQTVEQVNFAEYKTVPTLHPSWYFVDSILENTQVPVSSDQGIAVLEVLDALYASAGGVRK